jgi:hypothetical protein
MQMVIIIMTYLTLLGVMALLKLQFLDVMTGLADQASGTSGSGPTGDFGGDIDTDMLSMLFFHAVTLQALVSSFIAGYIRNVELMSGVKYAVALSTVALFVWILVNVVSGSGASAAGAALLPVAATGSHSVQRTRWSDGTGSPGPDRSTRGPGRR